MSNTYFRFKQFIIHQDRCAMKVTSDACLFGAWVIREIENEKPVRPAGGLRIKNVLDVGAGTGLLSLMFAQKNPETLIDTVEIDKNAAEQAKENIERSPWKGRITVIHADARKYSFTKHDLIISNPPFYEKEIKSEKEIKNLARHSENLRLIELLTLIKENLDPGGSFFLLLPYKRNEEVKRLLKDHQLHISKILFARQSIIHDYFRILFKGKLNSGQEDQTEIDEISIRDENQQYTDEFKFLLKDYYLNL